ASTSAPIEGVAAVRPPRAVTRGREGGRHHEGAHRTSVRALSLVARKGRLGSQPSTAPAAQIVAVASTASVTVPAATPAPTTAAVRSRLTAMRARRLEIQRTQLLEDVGLLQAALLPEPPPRLGPVETSAAYRPADGPGAGGDFYDIFALADGQLAVIVGDVAGH